MVLYHAHDGVLRQAVFRRIMSKDTIRLTSCMKKEQQSKYKQNVSFHFVDFHIYGAKLLQKSEMRKDIVIELSYKGFS